MARLFDHFDLESWRVGPPALPGGLYGLFLQVSALHASRRALETADGRSWTYAELESAVEQCRSSLAAGGAGPGDRVLACVGKTPANVFLYLACLSQGAVYVPVNPAYTPVEVQALIRDCAPRLVICEPSREPELWEAARGAGLGAKVAVLSTDGQITPPGRRRSSPMASRPRGDDPAIVLYTSGTTGAPRGAVLSHQAVTANVLALSRVWDMRPADILVHGLPLFHTHGLLVALQCALLSGASTILMPSFDPATAVGLFGRSTVFMAVPTYYSRLLDYQGFDRRAVSGMRLFTSGSAPLLPQVWEQFRRRCGHRIVERYGMTEVGIITSNPVYGDRVAGSVGYPLEGVEVKVVDHAGGDPGPASAGELWVRSAGAFTGYLNRAAETAAAVDSRGWVATGDMAVLGDDGRVSLKGRSKDLIITGGLNVHPMQVEVVLNSLPGVVESAVFGVPHPDFGEGVVAAVVWGGEGKPSTARLLEALSSRLAGYRIPKKVLWSRDLPRNAMGKVQKTVLRSRHAGLFAHSDDDT